MPLSDVFSVAAGILVLCVNLYLTFLILQPTCKITSTFVIGQALIGVLFFVYALLIVYESYGELGIGYLVYHSLLIILTSFNLFLIITRSCPITGWRLRFRNVLEKVGIIFWPVQKTFEEIVGSCQDCPKLESQP